MEITDFSRATDKEVTFTGYSKVLVEKCSSCFEKTDSLNQVKLILEEKSLLLRYIGREIVFLSLNASVSSYKIEMGGETFGILARDIRSNAKENDSLIHKIEMTVHELSSSLEKIVFTAEKMCQESEVLTALVDEALSQDETFSITKISQTIADITALVVEHSDKSTWIQEQLKDILTHLGRLEQQMLYLGYVQIYGIIEAAASRHESVSFEGIFSQLKTLLTSASAEIVVMQKMAERFRSENRLLMETTAGIYTLLSHLEDEMLLIKNVEV